MGESTTRRYHFGSDLELMQEVVATGRKVGADPFFWSRLAREEDLFRNIVDQVKRYVGEGPQCTIAQAAQIMGESNFHGPTAVRQLLGFRLRNRMYDWVPFSPQTLWSCKDTHILVAAPEVSITEIHNRVPQQFAQTPWNFFGVIGANILHQQIEPGWYLVQKDCAMSGLALKLGSWKEMLEGMASPSFVPSANLMVYACVLHKLATDEDLIERPGVYTRSLADFGRVVLVRRSGQGLYLEDTSASFVTGVNLLDAQKGQ